METHAHHLHKAPGKNFWHYFFEFFMLFLAVFCGFLAENFRENQLDKRRELTYMQNMYEDLKSDTVIYSQYTANVNRFMQKIDSLETLMKSPERDAHLNEIYFRARTATLMTQTLFPNQRTFEQMKDAGNLRLISNSEVADSISQYYNSLKVIAFQNQLIQDRTTDYMDGASEVFDSKIMFWILKKNKIPPIDSCKLVTNDPELINKFLVKAQYYYGARRLQNSFGVAHYKSAQNLIALIKKEYHFK